MKTYRLNDLSSVIVVEGTGLTRDNLVYYEMWTGKCSGEEIPAWRDFDWLEMPARVIPRVMLVDVLNAGEDFRYRFFGTWHCQCHRFDMTGKLVSEYDDKTYAEHIRAAYAETVAIKKPTKNNISIEIDNVPYRAEILRLPLAEDGTNVDKVLVCETPE